MADLLLQPHVGHHSATADAARQREILEEGRRGVTKHTRLSYIQKGGDQEALCFAEQMPLGFSPHDFY